MKHKRFILTLMAVLIPLGIIVVYGGKKMLNARPGASQYFNEASAAYHAKDFVKAGAIIAAQQSKILAEAEGCELIISVYAELANFSALEEVSRSCIATNRAEGIAHEGLAFSLSSQGKIAEALTALEAEQHKKPEVPRIAIALARLLVMSGQEERGGTLFIRVIEKETSWSMWLAEALKQSALLKQANFVEKLSQVVLKKELVFAQLEEKLEAAARALELKELAELLADRHK